MIREIVTEIVKAICRSDRSKADYIIYDGLKYRYRLYYEGQRWFNNGFLNGDNFICNIRVEYKEKDCKYYDTFCRIGVHYENNKPHSISEMSNMVYDKMKDFILDMDDIMVYKDFFS